MKLAPLEKTLIECRGMTWDENCDYEEFQRELLAEDKDISTRLWLRKVAKWVIEKVYKVDINQFTATEVLRIYETTMELTNAVREDEIKNLLPLANGSATEENTAQTAEE